MFNLYRYAWSWPLPWNSTCTYTYLPEPPATFPRYILLHNFSFQMYSYTIIAVCLVGVECLRRLCKIFLTAYTGPLSKIPGPFWSKFTVLPWSISAIRGDSPRTVPELFEKYGNTVRVGPNLVMVTGPKAVVHVLGHEDFPKDPKYAYLREDPKIANLLMRLIRRLTRYGLVRTLV
jgi:hypothetical protein